MKSETMKQALKQIAFCAVGLLIICAVCRLIFFRSYTIHIPIRNASIAEEYRQEGYIPGIEADSDIVNLGEKTWRGNSLSVRIHPRQAGETDLRILGRHGEEVGYYILRVGPMGTVYDFQTGGFTGDTAVLVSVTLFWLIVSAIMVWQYFQAKGPAYYAYSTIYFAGFSLFSLATGILMARVSFLYLIHPEDFSMFSAYGMITGASKQFMTMTMPCMVIFAAAMAVSNIVLLRHERTRLQNVLGLAVSIMLLVGEAIGFFLFYRNFSGSEWENRLQSTVENVYATVFVYFECMLVGSVICGVSAARNQPAPDKDFIVILGCWFRKDGSLPPLLKGRVDRALDFWQWQKEQSGKQALLIPSGGQGPDESMPEAEAMSRYLMERGVPKAMICPETESKNTFQNMVFSRRIAAEIQTDGKAVFSTTSYHVFRSGVWANLAGFPAEGIGIKTKWWFWPNAFMRECLGLIKNRWKQELLLLILLNLFFGALSMVLG